MAELEEAPWRSCFEVPGDPMDRIVLTQIGGTTFELGSTVIYIGDETGLEDRLDAATIDALRFVGPDRLPTTDLASVPGPLRWFVSTYGSHTPAALIHDWMITEGPPVIGGLTPQYADRYFRFMLRTVGVPWIRRWMMWAAVAMRTRWGTGMRHRLLLAVWLVAAIIGMGAFAAGLVLGSVGLVSVAGIAPFLFALLWGRQYAAGVVASLTAPWVLPPTVVGAVGYGVYVALEWLVGKASRAGSDNRPLSYQDF